MPEPGGPTAQSGILFQNRAAVLWLGRLLDPRERPPRETVTAVRVEALDAVDDIVVTFKDGHREYIQVKESLEPRGPKPLQSAPQESAEDAKVKKKEKPDDSWNKLWADFSRQRAGKDFGEGSLLVLLLGHEPPWARALQELCLRASGLEAKEWAPEKLAKALADILALLRNALPADSRGDAAVFAILHSTEVRFLDPERVREDYAPVWMPPASLKPFELFGKLFAKVGGEARIRRACTAEGLRGELAGEGCRIYEAGEAPRDGPEQVFLSRLPATNPDLFGRERELALLDAAWNEGKIRVLSLVAWGGVGKTALVNKWLAAMADDGYRGARRVYGWSFYNQGASEGKQASADPFIAHALGWFGDPDPTAGSSWDKGEQLARLIRRQRTLLVLDGVEPLQNPPPADPGCLKDPALKTLLCELAAGNPGLCVVTTRLPLADLESWRGKTVHEEALENLSETAGAAHLARLGVKGTEAELRAASREVGGHALALTLLGSYLADILDGDVRQRDQIPSLLDEEAEGDHARRMFQAYEAWFAGKPEGVILLLLGLFDRPAEAGALAALRAAPPIRGLTNLLFVTKPGRGVASLLRRPKAEPLDEVAWRRAVNHLRDARLLATADDADPDSLRSLEAHPLLREYFGKQLRTGWPAARREAHGRLYDYFCAQAPDQPDTLEEMAPLYAAVAHGCAADLYQAALNEVYLRRIQRGHEFYSTDKLGGRGADLAALAGFFEPPLAAGGTGGWTRVVDGLKDADKAWVLNGAGYDLRALGRLPEAAGPLRAGLEMWKGQKDWQNAARGAGNLSELLLAAGDVSGAIEAAEQGVELADRGEVWFERLALRAFVADTLHAAGRAEEAADLFAEAERIQQKEDPEHPLLFSLRGYQYCDLLLSQGEWREVQGRAEQTLAWMTQDPNGPLLTVALEHLSLARAGVAGALAGEGDFSVAAREMDAAVEVLRRAAQQDYMALGLLARAALRRAQPDFRDARADLDKALSIATRGGMRLHEADCRLEFARLALAEGDRDAARKSLTAARRIVEETGYARRAPEVEELERELKHWNV